MAKENEEFTSMTRRKSKSSVLENGSDFRDALSPSSAPRVSSCDSADYSILPSNDNEALRQQVMDLKKALKKAEAERDDAENRLAGQMESMLAYMKKMNLTVTRMP